VRGLIADDGDFPPEVERPYEIALMAGKRTFDYHGFGVDLERSAAIRVQEGACEQSVEDAG
jgi:hypothetical protein